MREPISSDRKKDKSIEQRAKIEVDEPLEGIIQNHQDRLSRSFDLTKGLTPKMNKDEYNTIKGHNLLGWCVALLIIIYVNEFFFGKNGATSQVGESIIEILKLLTFSLSGYLFGTNANKDK